MKFFGELTVFQVPGSVFGAVSTWVSWQLLPWGNSNQFYCSSRLALNKLKLSTEWEMEGIHGDAEGKQGVISYLKKKNRFWERARECRKHGFNSVSVWVSGLPPTSGCFHESSKCSTISPIHLLSLMQENSCSFIWTGEETSSIASLTAMSPSSLLKENYFGAAEMAQWA